MHAAILTREDPAGVIRNVLLAALVIQIMVDLYSEIDILGDTQRIFLSCCTKSGTRGSKRFGEHSGSSMLIRKIADIGNFWTHFCNF